MKQDISFTTFLIICSVALTIFLYVMFTQSRKDCTKSPEALEQQLKHGACTAYRNYFSKRAKHENMD